MNRIRLLAIGMMLLFALTTAAQQAKTSSDAQGGVPTAQDQLKVLTEKLNLTGDQQARITTILEGLHDATQKIMEDKSLSREERLAKLRPHRYKAHQEIREILNDEQKEKLDRYLQGPHPEMHGNLSGATPAAPQH